MDNKKICISKSVLIIISLILLIYGLVIFSKQLLTEKPAISSFAIESQTTCYPWDYKCLCGPKTTGITCKQYNTLGGPVQGQFNCQTKKPIGKCNLGCNIDGVSCNSIVSVSKYEKFNDKICSYQEKNAGRFKCFQIVGELNYYQFACGSKDSRYWKCDGGCTKDNVCEKIITTPFYTQIAPTPTSKPILTPIRIFSPTMNPILILSPTINPNDLRLQVLAVKKNGEYIGDAHIDFYDNSVKKYYGFFYAFAGDETTECHGNDGYKITPIGEVISITERIPTFSLKSERTSNGVTLYFLYQQKRYDLFTMAKNANHIVIGISNTNIPNVAKIACLED